MRLTGKELALGLLFAGGAVGVAMLGGRETTPYAYLFDHSKAETDQQRFLATLIQHSGLSQEELQPLLPRLRASWRELPVIVYVHRESGRPVAEILDLRKEGLDWKEIHKRLDLPVKSLFAGMKGAPPDPYKAAWTEWRMKYRPELTDRQIRELALLQVASQITGEPVDVVARKHTKGTDPETLIARHGPAEPEAAAAAETKGASAAPGTAKDDKARPDRAKVKAKAAKESAASR